MALSSKTSKTPGERFLSWAKGLSVIVATCIAIYAAFKGNEAKDNVDSTWEALKAKVDKQSDVINEQSKTIEKLVRRMVFFQGHQAGFSAGQLYEQKASLEKQLDDLRDKKLPKTVASEIVIVSPKEKPVTKSSDDPLKSSPTFQRMQDLPRFPKGMK